VKENQDGDRFESKASPESKDEGNAITGRFFGERDRNGAG